ncbi:MAG: TonB-dependent receptor [Bacteroidales bacterium]|nr:TonB-dependent receptor [Bacteroidales bacterium]
MKTLTKILAAGMLLIGSNHVMAQTTVKGVFADSLSKEAIPFATVAVPDPSQPGMYTMATVTDIDGSFSGQIKKNGKYQLTISYMGKMPVKREIVVNGQKVLDLGRILTTDVVDTLGVVEVVAVKPLVKAEAGKLTYNAQGDPESKTATVLDLLRKVPMVSVDGQDNITVNGNSSFQVHVNGKKDQMLTSRPSDALKSMPASAVLDIEVITDPGAKYDAEGVGGIINLITERGHKVNQTAGTVTIGTSTQGENKANFNVATNQNKLTLSLSGSVMQRGKQDMEMTSLTQNLMGDNNIFENEYTGKMGNKNLRSNLDLQASYEINDLNLISVNVGASSSNGDRTGDMFYRTLMGQMESNYVENTSSTTKWQDVWGGIDIQHNFKNNPKSLLTFSYKFSGDKSEGPSTATSNRNDVNSERKQTNDETSSEHTIQLDYILPIGEKFTMEDGFKYIYRPKNSESSLINRILNNNIWESMDPTYTEFSNNDKIAAAYTQFTGKLDKYTLKAGLRYEYTFNSVDQKDKIGGSFSKDYSSVVPSASITYNMTPMSNISFTYGMRISRPGIWFLNPFVDKSNPTSWSYGNPNLSPEKYHNFSIGYGKFGMKQSLNLTLRYTTCSTGITSYSFMDENIMHNTYTNGTDNNRLSLNGYYGYNFSPKTRIILNAGITYSDLNNDFTNERNKGWNGNIYGQFNQTIFWNIKGSLGFMASTRRKTINGHSNGMNFANLSLTKEFLDGKLTASVSGMCTLNHFDKMVFNSHTETSTYVSDMKFEIPMGRVQFSLSYRFGKSHVQVKKSKISIDNDDAGSGKSDGMPSSDIQQ